MTWMVISTCCALVVFVKSPYSPRYSSLFMGSNAWVVYFLHSHSTSSSNPLHLTIFFSSLGSSLNLILLGVPTIALTMVLDQVLQSKSLLPKQDMIRKFMDRKFDFNIQKCAILIAHTTTPILLDGTLKFSYSSSTPSPFLLGAIPSPNPIVSSPMNLSLFVIDQVYKNP